jgi:hypothetical protein
MYRDGKFSKMPHIHIDRSGHSSVGGKAVEQEAALHQKAEHDIRGSQSRSHGVAGLSGCVHAGVQRNVHSMSPVEKIVGRRS